MTGDGPDEAGFRERFDDGAVRGPVQSERLTDSEGLPRRPWYQHLLYAPGFYNGYGVKTLPGVREGIEQKRYVEAEQEALRAARALGREASLVEAAAADLERMVR